MADSRPPPAWFLIGAVAVVLGLPHVPLLSSVLLPLSWLGTLAHEVGHGLGAIAVGGSITSVEVFWNGSGVAFTSFPRGVPWHRAVVSASGLIGPAVASVVLLVGSLRALLARLTVAALGCAMIGVALLFAKGLATLVSAGWGLVFLVAAWRLPQPALRLATMVVAVQLALQVYTGSGYLFAAQAHTSAGVMPSDVANMASALGGPAVLWGVVVGVLDVVLLALGLGVLLRWGK